MAWYCTLFVIISVPFIKISFESFYQALWFTEGKGVEGPVFGSNDNWKGLGLFFDSFDNDNKHNNPFIMAMLNDGTQTYEHQL